MEMRWSVEGANPHLKGHQGAVVVPVVNCDGSGCEDGPPVLRWIVSRASRCDKRRVKTIMCRLW